MIAGENIQRIPGPLIHRDGLGNPHSIEIHVPSGRALLPEEPTKRLRALAEQFAGRPEVGHLCSVDYVTERLADWLERTRNAGAPDSTWTEAILERLAEDVQDLTVQLPLDGIQIERTFSLGHVEFGYFTANDVDWIIAQHQDMPADAERLLRERLTRRYQGRVITKFQCRAEPERARELAEFHTERALEALRFFHPSALDVRAPCFLGLLGKVTPAQCSVFYRADNMRKIPLLDESLHPARARDFMISEHLLEQLMDGGLGTVGRLLGNDARSELEEATLNAIAIFAWGVTSLAARDRLLHALVSVESLLVASESEAVTSNLGYRMAFLIRSDKTKRRALLGDLAKAYRLRSRFVHHGATPADVELMNRVIRSCWVTIIEVLGQLSRFKTKKELISALQDRILS